MTKFSSNYREVKIDRFLLNGNHRPAVYSAPEFAICTYAGLKIEGYFLPMHDGKLSRKQDGGCMEDSIATESNKPLICRDN